jgi:hypothetical protein
VGRLPAPMFAFRRSSVVDRGHCVARHLHDPRGGARSSATCEQCVRLSRRSVASSRTYFRQQHVSQLAGRAKPHAGLEHGPRVPPKGCTQRVAPKGCTPDEAIGIDFFRIYLPSIAAAREFDAADRQYGRLSSLAHMRRRGGQPYLSQGSPLPPWRDSRGIAVNAVSRWWANPTPAGE